MRNPARSLWLPLVAAVLSLWLSPPASAVSIDWVTVGNPGNLCDLQAPDGCFGTVANPYRIAKYEVTNAQYAEFLNAVAAAGQADPNGLYNTHMGSALDVGGITRTVVGPDYHYAAIPSRADMPVVFVSFWDATRFANWLHNGQPTGAQGLATTEGGAYTLTPAGISLNTVERNPGARVFLPSEDEWYKAAYHNAIGLTAIDYFDYPAGSDTQTTCSNPPGGSNHANCENQVRPGNTGPGDLAPVGSYTGSDSPYGTFDQGGNVSEWNEAINPAATTQRGTRGGIFVGTVDGLAASSRNFGVAPSEVNHTGFRVAAVIPEPGTGLLVMGGLLGLAGWRRRRA